MTSVTITKTDTPAATSQTLSTATPRYNDWRDDFYSQGYAVIKEAIPFERAQHYQQQAFKWLTSFGTPLDLSNPETWTVPNLPVQSKINTFANYAIAHEKFMWDMRLEPGVIKAFEDLWGTEELLVSFDSLNITLPNRKDKPRRGPWPHIDQSPLRAPGLQCAQGVINLSHAGPNDGGLTVLPGSNRIIEEFFEMQTENEKKTWEKKDIYWISESHMEWFKQRGIEPVKVCAEPGDLIIWDSRTVHWGAEPEEGSEVVRTVVYAAYAPAAMATKEAIKVKAQCFESWTATTHWPHDNIACRKTEALLEDGSVDPRNRDSPLEKPVMSDKLLRLAGIVAY